MTEPHEPDSPLEPPLDAAREAAVRRTLSEAGGPETTPAEVVARLDGVLEDLVAERSTPSVSHPESAGIVVPMDAAARRRRLRVRTLLGAAAAVVAVGVGAGVIQGQPGSDDDKALSADSAADEAPARDDSAGAGALSDEPAESAASVEAAPTAGDMASVQDSIDGATSKYAREPRRVVTDGPVRTVRPDHLREDLVALQHVSVPKLSSADYTVGTLSAPADFMCEPAGFGAGYLVGVTYGGKPAVVAFREPVGDTQEAEVLACGTGDVLHSTVLATTG